MTRVTVQALPEYTYAQLLTATGLSLVADEPADLDGDDLGPTPYDLLAWSLGACTAMTIQLYARRKGYPLEDIKVHVEHERTHAKDCAGCEDRDGRIDVLRRKIVVRGPLTNEQRDDLLRIAARCPVHKTLQAMPKVLDSIRVED